MNEITLKPCPFCGGAETVHLLDENDMDAGELDENALDARGWPYPNPHYCVNCRWGEGGCGTVSGYHPTAEEAAAAWNRRWEATT